MKRKALLLVVTLAVGVVTSCATEASAPSSVSSSSSGITRSSAVAAVSGPNGATTEGGTEPSAAGSSALGTSGVVGAALSETTDPNAPPTNTDPNAPPGGTDPNAPPGGTDPNAPPGETDPNAGPGATDPAGQPQAPGGQQQPDPQQPDPQQPDPQQPAGPQGPQAQTIDFPSPGEHVWPDKSVTLQATASSGLSVRYDIADGSVCIKEGAVIRVEQLGGCTIRASQPGVPGEFEPAPEVTRDFYVGGQRLDIHVENVPVSAIRQGDLPRTLAVVVTSANSAEFSADLNVSGGGACQGGVEKTVSNGASTPVQIDLDHSGAPGSCNVTISASGQYVLFETKDVTFGVT